MATDIQIATKVIVTTQKLLDSNQFEQLDILLAQVDVSQCTVIEMLSWLRSTYAWRTQLKEWIPLRDRTAKQLENVSFSEGARTYGVETVMRGLL